MGSSSSQLDPIGSIMGFTSKYGLFWESTQLNQAEAPSPAAAVHTCLDCPGRQGLEAYSNQELLGGNKIGEEMGSL